jgi:hypothetical protein
VPWEAVFAEDGTRHVIPLDDLRPHSDSEHCWCNPFDYDGVTVHNSMDRREEYERGRPMS